MSENRDEVRLSETFALLARVLSTANGVDATLAKICELATATIDGCESAGIALLVGNRVEPWAGTGETPGKVDRIQTETMEGPCVDAIAHHEAYVSGDLLAEQRWPAFAERANAETGIRSIASFRLYSEADTIGSLNLYSPAVDAFGDDDLAVAAVFSAHAAVAVHAARREEQLEEALRTRDLIGQAKGIIMAARGCSADEAFEALRSASQRLNVKLRDVADDVALTGRLSGSDG